MTVIVTDCTNIICIGLFFSWLLDSRRLKETRRTRDKLAKKEQKYTKIQRERRQTKIGTDFVSRDPLVYNLSTAGNKYIKE